MKKANAAEERTGVAAERIGIAAETNRKCRVRMVLTFGDFDGDSRGNEK